MRIIERIRRVFVVFSRFSDLQAVFTDLCNSLFCLLLTLLLQKWFFARTFICLLIVLSRN